MSTASRLVDATIVTQDRAGTVIPNGEVAFDTHGVITYVGPARGPAGPEDHHLPDAVLLPGLVNAHTHSAMTLLRGSCDDADLATWLGVVQSLEQHMSAADVAIGLRLAMVEMLHSGTTTFADMYHWDANLLGLVTEAGMRVSAAHAVFDFDSVAFPAVSQMSGRDALTHTEELAKEFAGDDRVQLRYGPHAPYTCPPDMLAEVATRAQHTGLGVHIHLAESDFEVRNTLKTYGRRPILHADHAGLFRVPVLVAHAVHASREEVELLASRDAAVGHNPVSNLKLGSGVAPLASLRDAGVSLGLGTDGAASNNSMDLLEEVKMGALIHRGVAQDPEQITATDVLNMATSSGARAVGYPHVGVLEPGRWADIVAVRTDTAQATPLFSAPAFLTFSARGSDVREVFIGGMHVLRNGELTTINETTVREEAAEAAQQLARLAADQR